MTDSHCANTLLSRDNKRVRPLGLTVNRTSTVHLGNKHICRLSTIARVRRAAPTIIQATGNRIATGCIVITKGTCLNSGMRPRLTGHDVPYNARIVAARQLSRSLTHSLVPGGCYIRSYGCLLSCCHLATSGHLLCNNNIICNTHSPSSIRHLIIPGLLGAFPRLGNIGVSCH